MTESLTPAYRAMLAAAADGLDLADAEDRAVFRLRVQRATASATLDVLRRAAADLGATSSPTRSATVRALADLHIEETLS